jgi:hypothetical protein
VLARKAGLNAAAVIAAICIAWFAVIVSGEGKSIRLCFSRRLPGRGSWREELCWHPPGSVASACLMPCWELPCAGNGLSRSQLTFVISWAVWGLARSSLSIVLVRDSWSYPSWITVLPTGGAALLIGAGDRAWVTRAPRRHNAG